jgi:hypothetical protein
MSLRSRLGLPSLLTATLVACSPYVEGNGVYAERVFNVGSGLRPFDGAVVGFPSSVNVNGQPLSASVFVDAAAERQVILSGDQNVIEHIKVETDGSGVLRTSIDKGYDAVHPPQLRIKTPQLGSVESIGGADVTVVSMTDGHVTLTGAGGSQLAVVLSGGAQLDASAYPVASAQVDLTGGARASIWPTSRLAGTASAGSAVLVKGSVSCAEVVLGAGSSCGPL